MAADTKRGADPRALCGVFRQFLGDTTLTVDWLERALAAQGLHVVTAAEKAVLDAALDYHRLDTSVNEERLRHYCRVAFAARREAAK